MSARKRPHRIALDVDTDLHDWISQQRFQDHLSTSDRVRALLTLSREDPELNARVVKRAGELAEAWANQQK